MKLLEEKGTSLAIVAGTMAAMLAVTALLVDGGRLLVERRRMQNAADAAALAGVREVALAKKSNEVRARIDEYAITRNGATGVEARYRPGGEEILSGKLPDSVTGVVVTTTRQFPTILAGILGHNQMTVSAVAEAGCGKVVAIYPLAPMIVHWLCDPLDPSCTGSPASGGFEIGVEYRLWGDKSGPGGFHWVDWDGNPSDNNELAGNLSDMSNSINPATGNSWQIGEMVPSGPGVSTSEAVETALDTWLAKPEDERHWTVPIYDVTDGSGVNLRYHIVAFAEFIVTGYDFSGMGSDKYISGKFVGEVVPTGTDISFTDCRELTIFGVVLTR